MLNAGDLLSNVNPNYGMSADDGLSVMHGLCAGLAYIHDEHQLAHLDLKCENVLVEKKMAGQSLRPRYTAKIADFDAAVRIGSSMHQVRGTSDIHPPEYLAVDASGRHTATSAADMWAVGLVAHVVLFGRYAWDMANANDPKYVAYRQNPTAAFPASMPSELADLFARFFAVEAGDRISASTAGQLICGSWVAWVQRVRSPRLKPKRPAAPSKRKKGTAAESGSTSMNKMMSKLGKMFSKRRRERPGGTRT